MSVRACSACGEDVREHVGGCPETRDDLYGAEEAAAAAMAARIDCPTCAGRPVLDRDPQTGAMYDTKVCGGCAGYGFTPNPKVDA